MQRIITITLRTIFSIFNINKIIDNKTYILKEKEYSLAKLEKEFIVDTSVELNYLNEKIINLRFTLVNSYIKKTIIYISYNYSTHNIDNATCDLCLKPYSINNFKNCCHVVYLLKSYNEGKIDGCLDKFNIDEMFSNHMAIFGNSGSGKSYSTSSQNLCNN